MVRTRPSWDPSPSIHFLHADFPLVLPAPEEIPDGAIFLHLAGLTHTCRQEEYLQVNTLGTQELLLLAQKRQCMHFIYISTRAIHPTGGAYAQSKRAAEKYVQKSNIPHTILRFSEVYGAGSEGISAIIDKIRDNNTVLLPGDGLATVAPLHIHDAVHAIELTIQENAISNVITITGPQEMSLNEFVARTSKQLGRTPRVYHIPTLVLNLFAPFVCLLRNPPFVPDQLARLRSPKDISSKSTLAWLKPCTLEEGLRYGKAAV